MFTAHIKIINRKIKEGIRALLSDDLESCGQCYKGKLANPKWKDQVKCYKEKLTKSKIKG